MIRSAQIIRRSSSGPMQADDGSLSEPETSGIAQLDAPVLHQSRRLAAA